MARRVARKAKKREQTATAGTAVNRSTKVKNAGKVVNDAGAARPTAELMARVEFEYGPVKTEMNIQIGAAYRRQPLYLTMAKKAGRFTLDELAALAEYRGVFDRCDRSPCSSCLANPHGGRGTGAPSSFINASPAIVEARRKLALLESELGIYLGTMRAVVLEDKSFSAIAMERYGCRARSWIVVDEPVMRNGVPVVVDGKPVLRAAHREDVVPRSGRDREKVAIEFREGLKRLVLAADRLGRVDINELWVHVRSDGSATIRRASHAPNGTFRLWGRARTVDEVLDDLVRRYGDTLDFRSAEAARDVLDAIDGGRLKRLEPDELAT